MEGPQGQGSPWRKSRAWLARGGAALGLAAGMLLAAPAQANVTSIEVMQGWVNSDGGSNRPGPDSNNYTGVEISQRFNSWAAFYIPAGHYTSATLSLTPSTYGAAVPSIIGLFQVDTPFATMEQDFMQGTGVYKDLGSGRQYASVTLFNSPVSFDLNGRGLADINLAAGSFFLIGFTNQTTNALPLNADAAGIYISGFGRNQHLMELELGQAAPVPEPSTWAAMVAGLALLGLRTRQQRRRGGKLASAALAAGALALAPAAHATVVDFENLPDVSYIMDGGSFEHAGYQFTGQFAGEPGEGGGLVGAVLDGSYADLCSDGGLTCPSNNSSHYYGGLVDGVVHMQSLQAGAPIKLSQFDASFIGGQQGIFPDVSGLLQIRGFRADGTYFDEAYALQAPVMGFAHYQTSAEFQANNFVQLAFFAYACNFEEQCFAFNSNMGQFGIDNLEVSAVPEPSSYMMLGLGLFMLAGLRRRAA
jgi:hypothetical protein